MSAKRHSFLNDGDGEAKSQTVFNSETDNDFTLSV